MILSTTAYGKILEWEKLASKFGEQKAIRLFLPAKYVLLESVLDIHAGQSANILLSNWFTIVSISSFQNFPKYKTILTCQ